MKTDGVPRKRSFAQVATTSTSFGFHASECDNCTAPRDEASGSGRAPPRTGRSCASSHSKMPVQASPPPFTSHSFPSFRPVFGNGIDQVLDSDRLDGHRSSSAHPQREAATTAADPPLSFVHRESVSSSIPSESTESSPTTTISTFDTTSVTDTSPSSSPESPSSLPLSYPKPMILPGISEHTPMPPVLNVPSIPQPPIMNSVRPISPGRRGRNLKNLSLKVPYPSSRPAISTASVLESTSHNLSAPPSPINRPSKSARRKPANLTIRTPGFDQSFSRTISHIVPPTPSAGHALRHFESTPSLASLFSPTTAPPGGMAFPRPATRDGIPLMPGSWQDDSPMSPQMGTLQQVTEEDDHHLDSRESTKRKERGYSDGPIKIYDSGVYLYLEPTREEASRFDVVINVAKEVVNPFAADLEQSNTVVSALRQPLSRAKRCSIAEPMTAISEASFHSALEVMPSGSESPTTPKADKSTIPEYIHVAWDHNSEILDDLGPLCQLIDERVSQGKSVLVHCQLGASRSASLVIAYGLYKNPDLDFNDMYGIVKDRSCWVGPNMSLIYQLTDFRSRVRHGTTSNPPKPEWFKTASPAWEVDLPIRQNNPSVSLSVVQMDTSETSEPATSPPTVTFNPLLPRTIYSPNEIPAMPAAAPLNPSKPEPPTLPNTSPRPFPLREKYETTEPLPAIPAHDRFETRRTAHIRYPSVHMDLIMNDVPTSPSLLSPKVTSFLSSPLSRTIAGDLAGDGPSVFAGFGQPFFDPRSPPQRNEPLIMRSIDEFL